MVVWVILGRSGASYSTQTSRFVPHDEMPRHIKCNGAFERLTRNDSPGTCFIAGVRLTIMTAFDCSNTMKNVIFGIRYMHWATAMHNHSKNK
ncbi:hypothetical protein L873DRAFT_197480 [Choiromyces venosus 120613-1]|uniref:Uncharacterized protein n=1 Tax=Choiromyces venosus 120613-1 TaxID=1336337 RepID=A0A3N4J215_9PEZI|nr:hypothetical protein L873DRAFT_197480 [Choiromyces venosus 120613-1]